MASGRGHAASVSGTPPVAIRHRNGSTVSDKFARKKRGRHYSAVRLSSFSEWYFCLRLCLICANKPNTHGW